MAWKLATGISEPKQRDVVEVLVAVRQATKNKGFSHGAPMSCFEGYPTGAGIHRDAVAAAQCRRRASHDNAQQAVQKPAANGMLGGSWVNPGGFKISGSHYAEDWLTLNHW